ncbi:MAG TPA: calcium-binding protein, partial [Tepidisphaeraceae bacterium]|nr:calcium-binding protein [Tepidisphaeraceae bacterium]
MVSPSSAAAHVQQRRWAEHLEPRVMLTGVTSSVAAGTLSITVDDATGVAITASAGQVKINGSDPGGGASAASGITHITVTASGAFDNAIDFSQVVPGTFSSLTQVTVDADGGTGDALTGPNVAKTWNVTGSGAGTITYAGGPSFSFSNVEQLAGSASADTLSYAGISSGVTVNLKTGAATDFSVGVTGMDNLTGGSGDDNLTGNDNNNVIRGLGGNDTLTPLGGRDSLYGGDGTDQFNGGPSISSTFGDLLFAKLAQIRRLIEGDINNASFTGYVYNKEQVPFISFGQGGNRLQDVEKADVIATFYNVLHTALNGLTTTSDIQQVLYTSLGNSGSGLNILADANANGVSDVDDVTMIVDNTAAGNAKIEFQTPLHKSALNGSGNPNFDTDTQLDLDTHLPGLPLAGGATTHGGVIVAAGYDYNLAFGVSQSSGVFIDESQPDELHIDLRAALTVIDGDSTHAIYHDPDGSLGVLYASIEDQPLNHSSMQATLTVNFVDETTAPTVKINGEADYHLRMATRSTEDGLDTINPIYNANMDATWTFGTAGSPQLLDGTSLLGTKPTITFSSVTMDANSFFQNFVKPIVDDHIRSIFSSIDGLVEVMTYKLPVLGVSMAEVFDNPVLSTALVGNFAAFFNALEVYKDMTFPSPGGTVDLGSFTIQDDARAKNHGPNNDDFVDIADANITPPAVDPITQLRNKSSTVNSWFDNLDLTFQYGFGGTPGIAPFANATYHLLQFPMFTGHAINSFHMLLGHHADLLKWDVPPLSVFYTFVVKQQLFPPGPEEVDAGDVKAGKTAGLVAFFVLRPSFQAHWAGGYDTHGFEIETPSEGYYLNGTDQSQVHPPSVHTIADDFTQGQLTTSFMRLNIDVSALVGASLPLGPLNIDIGVG